MSPELINHISNSLMDIMPENWEELKVRLNVNEGFFEMLFFVKVNNQWIYCYDLPKYYDLSLDEIDNLFDDIGDVFLEGETKKWCSATLLCFSTGMFHVTYEYDERVSLEEWIEINIK